MQTEQFSVEAIAKINDQLRRGLPLMPPPHILILTDEVAALPAAELSQLLALVRDFNNFTPDNDPHSEHDFGKIDLNGQAFFGSSITTIQV